MYKNTKKIVIAPQIVVYKNIFKYSKELIDLLKEDNKDSIIDSWVDWYSHGQRRRVSFDKFNLISDKDLDIVKKEKKYLKEIYNITDFINTDYFNQFKDNGTWPNFIEDWKKMKSIEDVLYIDYFMYDEIKQNKIPKEPNDLLMDYHIDEFEMSNNLRKRRHVATLNFYLNDEYEGGEICAYDNISKKSYKYKPSTGDVVIMPSTEPFYHAVKQYHGANRYFARTFLDYISKEDVAWDNKYRLEGNIIDIEFVKKDLQLIKINTEEILVKGDA
jgi:hypothetical protein